MNMAQASEIFQTQLRETLRKDDSNRQVLIKAYTTTERCAENEVIREHIMEFDQSFFSNMKQVITDLKEVDRPILVLGETSAGKSSFLNLLIEREILPELTAPCTYCLCRIKQGPKLRAHVTSLDGSTRSKVLDKIGDGDTTDDVFCEKLQELVSEKKCSTDPRRCIDIFVPSTMLESNLYFVDTRGLDADDNMTLIEYLPKAIGIIFILNSTVNLGIASDRGVQILNKINELIRKGTIPSFDPRNVVFIANKWDQVGENERNEHKKKICEKLKMFWPHFQDDDLLPLSVTTVKDKIKDPQFNITKYSSAMEDYHVVLDKVRAVVQRCANARSKAHARNLKELLEFLALLVEDVESFSEHDKATKLKSLQALVDGFETKYKQGERTFEAICEKRRRIAQDVIQHLQDPAKRKTIFTWDTYACPDGKDLLTIKYSACVLVRSMVLNVIKEHIENSEIKQNNLMEIILMINGEEEKMRNFFRNSKQGNTLQEENISDSSYEQSDEELSTGGMVALAITAPLWIPLGLVSLITVVPIAAAVQSVADYIQVKKYKRNRNKYLDKWTKELLDEVYTLSVVEQLIYGDDTKMTRAKLDSCAKSVGKYKHVLKHLDPKERTQAVLRGYVELGELYRKLNDIAGTLDQ